VHLAVCLAFVLGVNTAPQPVGLDQSSPIGRAFGRLYSFDFQGAHDLLDARIEITPDDPLPHAVKAAAYFFSELDRLKILQMDFFMDDDHVVDRRKLKPDPRTRETFFRTVEQSKQRALRVLAARPDDPNALFAICMATGLVTDYAALVERRRFGSFSLAKQNHVWVRKLLGLQPPVYDAYLTLGTAEYVVSRIPFFLRWFVRLDKVEGNRRKAVEDLELVAAKGRYYGPFARVLLSVIHLRDRRPQEAERLLAGLAAEFPDNPLIRRELQRAGEQVRRVSAAPGR